MNYYNTMNNYDFNNVSGGNSMISRMDSDFTDMWNRGFTKIITNGVFKKLCDDAKNEHGKKGKKRIIYTYQIKLHGLCHG